MQSSPILNWNCCKPNLKFAHWYKNQPDGSHIINPYHCNEDAVLFFCSKIYKTKELVHVFPPSFTIQRQK